MLVVAGAFRLTGIAIAGRLTVGLLRHSDLLQVRLVKRLAIHFVNVKLLSFNVFKVLYVLRSLLSSMFYFGPFWSVRSKSRWCNDLISSRAQS